jgi:hypothetical protein
MTLPPQSMQKLTYAYVAKMVHNLGGYDLIWAMEGAECKTLRMVMTS